MAHSPALGARPPRRSGTRRLALTACGLALALGTAAPAAAAPPPATQRWLLRVGPSAASPPRAALAAALDRAAAAAERLGARVHARTTLAFPGLALDVPARLDPAALRALPGVTAATPSAPLAPLALGDTALMGVDAAAQAFGTRGAGVQIGLVDTGLDYLHPALGGSGAPADYAANDPTRVDDGDFFPTARVPDGRDFTGAEGGHPDADPFPDGDLADPRSPAHHGTAVAATVAAVAPEARLFALKVFAAGAATTDTATVIAALDWALDPNGDGDPSDALDIVLLALGGEPDPDDAWAPTPLREAIAALHAAGTLVVTAAGNTGRRAFALAPPCAYPEALCVGATLPAGLEVGRLSIDTPAAFAGKHAARPGPVGLGAHLGASDSASGPVVPVDDPCGPAPWAAATASAVALVDADACPVADVLAAAELAGAVAVLLRAPPGELETWPLEGESAAAVPVALVGASTAETLLGALALGADLRVTLRGSSAEVPALIDTVAHFSARGPGWPDRAAAGQRLVLKPDLAAPGYAVAAPLAGPSGGWRSFHGTSFAAARVAGVAALLRERRPQWSARDLFAALVATAAPAWVEDFALLGGNPAYGGRGVRAPLTLGGAGRVDAVSALSTDVVAHSGAAVAVDFGFMAVSAVTSAAREVRVVNHGEGEATFAADFVFRDAARAQAGVRVSVTPSSVTVPAGGEATVTVALEVDPRSLPLWPLLPTSFEAGWGGEPERLTQAEFDGYVRLSPASGGTPLSVPFYLLPRRAAEGAAGDACLAPTDFELRVPNAGLVRGQTELFTLVLTDPDEPSALDALDLRAVGVRLTVRGGREVVQFALATADHDARPATAPMAVALDVDEDGQADFVLASLDAAAFAGGLPTAAGACAVLAPDAEGELELPYGRFRVLEQHWTVADLVGSVRILTAPLDLLGLGAGANFDFWVLVPHGRAPFSLVDAAPHHGSAAPLVAELPATVDTSCQLWRFEDDALFYEQTGRALLAAAPSCPAAGDGLLLAHLGNAPDGLGWELLTPPTSAEYTCADEMPELADPATCTGSPEFAQYIDGPCDGAITAAPVNGRAFFPPGKSDATLEIVDPWGNTTRCDTTVVIEDLTLPTIDCGDVTRIEQQGGFLPFDHAVSASDACGAPVAEIVGWRCLLTAGEERYDLSSTCAVDLHGGSMTLRDLGLSANLLEWTVRATDGAGNEAQKACVAVIGRDQLVAEGGGGLSGWGCGGGAASGLLGGLAALATLAARAAARRRGVRAVQGAKGAP